MESGQAYAAEPPAEPPKRDADWPLWFPLAALGAGLAAGLLVFGVVQGVLDSAGVNAKAGSPVSNIVSTTVVDLSVVAACFAIAAMAVPPRPWQFGLRRAPLGRVLGAALAGAVVFIAWEAAYQGLFHPRNPQRVVQDLGADLSTTALIVGAIVVVGLAPVCEELFFRGFLYRALRLRLGIWVAALLDGIGFGLVHGSLVLVPVLGALGLIFCLVYEYTGTVFATIAMHAANNTVAYGATAKHGWPPALAVGGVVMIGCLVGARVLAPAPRSLPG